MNNQMPFASLSFFPIYIFVRFDLIFLDNTKHTHTNYNYITPAQIHLLTPPSPAPASLSATWPQTAPFYFSLLPTCTFNIWIIKHFKADIG
jgi:hypothetical protein